MHPSRFPYTAPSLVFSLLSVVLAKTTVCLQASRPTSLLSDPDQLGHSSIQSAQSEPSSISLSVSPGVIIGAIIGALIVASAAVFLCCRRCYGLPSRKSNSYANRSVTAFRRIDSPHEADPGRAQLEEEVEGLRLKVARLEAERVAAGLPPGLDARTRGGSNGTDTVHVGEKDEAAARAYTEGLATMGGLKGELIHQSSREMVAPPPKYEG
ncbi:hypothetical protein C8J57DRAFT_1377053 [Mycena rebaudengoi]|nr:hypothetical protein C8J57DRAFT_1377053 [Mycena rebaudengoi]